MGQRMPLITVAPSTQALEKAWFDESEMLVEP